MLPLPLLGIYSLAHLWVDLSCALLLFRTLFGESDWMLCVLLYNFCAFALQMPLGAVADRLNRNGLLAASGCLLVAVRRGGQELIPRGDTVLMEGDTLVALAGTEQYAAVKAELQELCAAEPVGHQKKG